ncbi:MAG: FAD-dependent oxidoreductase [Pseudomonadota bacterium]
MWWEEQGAGLAAMQAKLSSLGYPVQRLNRDEIAMREPAIVPPQEALLFPDEGVAEAGDVTRRLLEASGAKVMLGSRVEALVHNHRGIKGVRLAQGDLEADQVIVAAGTGAEALLSSADVPLPIVHRPALLVCTKPVDITLTHVLVGPHGELRQLPDGRLLIPAAVNHQGVTAQGVGRPDRVADATMDRLRPFLPGRALDWETVVHAARPVPKDGLPVIGRAADGLYVAVMHSGVTLAALTGALVAEELEGRLSNLLGPYRPQRF